MSYVDRTLQNTVEQASRSFPVVLITGPRQVGKTSMLQAMLQRPRSYITLDDPIERSLAREDPELFLQTHQAPILIDEIQYAPELFPYIKMEVDRARLPGTFWLTGSQQFHLMKNVSESLAGRVAILSLLGFSLAEESGNAASSKPFLPEPDEIKTRSASARTMLLEETYEKIWRGAFPFMVLAGSKDWEIFYRSYVQSYLQRDVRDFAQIGDELSFIKFLRAAAARTGQLINYADLARDVNVSQPTIKSWINILIATGLVYILEPYHTNQTKRLVKTPKLYFLDTGLCCYLSGWSNSKVLERGAMSGAMLETYVIGEVVKSYWHNGRNAPIFFYRDRDQKEIDLVIEQNGMLYPIEIKKAAAPGRESITNFQSLDKLPIPKGHGAVICLRERHIPLSRDVDAVPVAYLSC